VVSARDAYWYYFCPDRRVLRVLTTDNEQVFYLRCLNGGDEPVS
jgi:hypothetical protein